MLRVVMSLNVMLPVTINAGHYRNNDTPFPLPSVETLMPCSGTEISTVEILLLSWLI